MIISPCISELPARDAGKREFLPYQTTDQMHLRLAFITQVPERYKKKRAKILSNDPSPLNVMARRYADAAYM